MKKITIGIPKAFLFYRYNILWTTYLKKLKCKIIYSNNTNKNTIRLGNTYSIDESCLSSKIYLGHVAEIKDICDYILVPIGGGGLATGVSTLAKLLNPNVKVIGVEPEGASCMKASLKAGKVVTLDSANTIADGTAVKTPGTKIFPYIQKNLDDIITIPDEELIVAFLDMVENHKMVVENSGLLTVAALKHLDFKKKKVVSILSGGNMDIITMSSTLQHGLIERGRIFTISVLLPDKPGELVKVANVIAEAQGNVVKLEHNQFVSINRNAAVELKITLESFGNEHKAEIIKALEKKGYNPKLEVPVL